MDISLLVLAVKTQNSSYHRGDIIDVSIMHNEECTHPRFVLVNITDLPDKAPPAVILKRMKTMLERPAMVQAFSEQTRRRAWRVNYEGLPANVRKTLLEDRKITVPWTVAKSHIGKRIVTNVDQPETDTLIYIKDGDV